MNNNSIKCRCVFCGNDSRVNDRVFVCSERRYGKDRAFWGICNKCLAVCMDTIADRVIKP